MLILKYYCTQFQLTTKNVVFLVVVYKNIQVYKYLGA